MEEKQFVAETNSFEAIQPQPTNTELTQICRRILYNQHLQELTKKDTQETPVAAIIITLLAAGITLGLLIPLILP